MQQIQMLKRHLSCTILGYVILNMPFDLYSKQNIVCLLLHFLFVIRPIYVRLKRRENKYVMSDTKRKSSILGALCLYTKYTTIYLIFHICFYIHMYDDTNDSYSTYSTQKDKDKNTNRKRGVSYSRKKVLCKVYFKMLF